MKLASTCPNSDMGVVWGFLCLHPNTIKPRYVLIPYFKILLDINFHWNRRSLTIFRFRWRPFWKRWHRKNDPECNFHHYQSIPHFKITLDINLHWNQRTLKWILLMISDFNENWYLGVFWSKELVCNDEICIQGHLYEAAIFKMTVNKIVKLSMVSDFNVNWYLGAIFIITNQFLTSK
jgi:hypothetical protein